MKILIDQSNILTIENPNIPKIKEYTNIASGYKFSDYDKWIIVYHKKEIKIINLKNLWDSMNVFYFTKRETLVEEHLNQDWFASAFGLFSGFDENSWKKYFFIPRMKESELKPLNENLDKLLIDIWLEKSDKWIVVNQERANNIPVVSFSNETERTNVFSFLFWLVLIYGKIDTKNWEIIWIKIHLVF